MSQTSTADTRTTSSILNKSAKGATFLILLQIGSRALTFIVNQVLLRYLSPEILGISTQLELFAISVLYFARESLRVALQRQRLHHDDPEPESREGSKQDTTIPRVVSSYGAGRGAQEVVNLSYIAIGLGLPITYVFAKLYLRSAGPAVLETAYIHHSLNVYALATFLELLSEPCFAVAQQQMLYGTRASAETFATSARCIITCGAAICASKIGFNLGSLPFALGQLSYATVLNAVYLFNITPLRSHINFSLVVRPLPSTPNLFLSRFSLPILNIALNLYAQSTLKHILTTGDALLIAALASLPSQGAYALASNYGSLVARILFQPLEESSRSLFGRLLPPQRQHTTSSKKVGTPEPERRSLEQATNYLCSLLHFYGLVSLLSTSLGPTVAPLLLRLIAGPRWTSTAAPAVLSAYCYYIPLLALNGILEAFVSAVATPAELRQQSAWMLAFSAAFATTGYFVLKVWDMGARGLVLANAINMILRIWWSWGFVREYFNGKGISWRIEEVSPRVGSAISGALVAWGLRVLGRDFDGRLWDFAKWAGVAGGYGLTV
ncbi:Oligosaccharide translocation protein rft1 [Pseudocyphellaria aurata]|nr:Oligosaccharide translocation protein rft1 [Pseudocyphellaria aurata]